ncbi:MAG: hypothetical protein IIY49_11045 [Eubacterium sp.]|nr:hypothetical protein [Eubacterium sp.]
MRKRSIIITISFCLYILIFSLGVFLKKDRKFSDLENRNLTLKPSITFEKVKTGEYTEEIEAYLSDQIIFKDDLVRLSTSVKHFMGYSLMNGVYVERDGSYLTDFRYDEDKLSKNIGYINDFVDKNKDRSFYFLMIPNASYYYSKKREMLPSDEESLAISYIKDNLNKRVELIDISPALGEHRDEYIFYRTDHHWTQDGAYLGYEELIKALGETPVSKEEYDRTEMKKAFLGSSYSKAPVYTAAKDDFILYDNKNNTYNVDITEESISFSDVYNYKNLYKKDMYTTYLDGNHAMEHITSKADNDEKMLIIKDSYAHALVPFLADNYSDIYMADLRYFHTESLSKFMKDNNITKVIFIYNIDFIDTDDNFVWLY